MNIAFGGGIVKADQLIIINNKIPETSNGLSFD